MRESSARCRAPDAASAGGRSPITGKTGLGCVRLADGFGRRLRVRRGGGAGGMRVRLRRAAPRRATGRPACVLSGAIERVTRCHSLCSSSLSGADGGAYRGARSSCSGPRPQSGLSPRDRQRRLVRPAGRRLGIGGLALAPRLPVATRTGLGGGNGICLPASTMSSSRGSSITNGPAGGCGRRCGQPFAGAPVEIGARRPVDGGAGILRDHQPAEFRGRARSRSAGRLR